MTTFRRAYHCLSVACVRAVDNKRKQRELVVMGNFWYHKPAALLLALFSCLCMQPFTHDQKWAESGVLEPRTVYSKFWVLGEPILVRGPPCYIHTVCRGRGREGSRPGVSCRQSCMRLSGDRMGNKTPVNL